MTNLEVIQTIYQAFGEGDFQKMASLFSPDWVGTVPESQPMSGTYRGAEAFITQFISNIPTTWPGFQMEPIAFYESGNTVFVHHKITIGGKTSEGIHMSVVKEGKAISWQPFDDTSHLTSTASV
ncbi:MAG: hypothetical protein CMM30_04585 [Rhodospirillaceae bacterium]|nr:hypothetical protein [Alphaproteobacteria bacterium]MBR72200.1 hypothetical protein [Rhodospirillaceae bacterium]|tara:strand:- start:1853 stop:2224 length:372 start_codon:yes stop_codon:yes gene_type:complete